MGITPQQFQALTDRLSGNRRSPEPVFSLAPRSTAGQPEIIIGIDPSLRGTGYGIIRLAKARPIVLTHGTIACSAGWTRSRCLVQIAQELRQVIGEHKPRICAIEGLFYAQNLQTALIMGEARGVCLLAAAEAGLTIYEIAARKVKQAIVGYGAAQKLAVAKMVQRLLQLNEPPAADAADALALAITYAQECRSISMTLLKPL